MHGRVALLDPGSQPARLGGGWVQDVPQIGDLDRVGGAGAVGIGATTITTDDLHAGVPGAPSAG